jgi:hypothetical protein
LSGKVGGARSGIGTCYKDIEGVFAAVAGSVFFVTVITKAFLPAGLEFLWGKTFDRGRPVGWGVGLKGSGR